METCIHCNIRKAEDLSKWDMEYHNHKTPSCYKCFTAIAVTSGMRNPVKCSCCKVYDAKYDAWSGGLEVINGKCQYCIYEPAARRAGCYWVTIDNCLHIAQYFFFVSIHKWRWMRIGYDWQSKNFSDADFQEVGEYIKSPLEGN